MSLPLLSIITVTRNCVSTLPATLASVGRVKAEAGAGEVEYVVVDGASTDGTRELLESKDGLVDRLVSEPDTGIYNAMNKGVALAQGKWTLFINGDDELIPAGFREALPALRRQREGVLSGVTRVGSIEQPTEVLQARPARLPYFNTIPHPSSFVSTALMKRFPFREDLRIAADYDLFLRLYLAGVTFAQIDAPLALHQRGGASGDSARSQAELDQVRRLRLGWRLPFFNLAHHGWRLARRLAGKAR